MRLCGHWRRRYDKRYNNRTILSGKECVTQIGSKSKAGGNAALPDLTVFIQQYSGIRDDDVVSDPCYQDIKSTVFFYCKRVKTGHHAFDDHGVVQLISDEEWSSVVPCMDFHDHRSGLRTAVYMAIRLIYLIIGSSLMTFTTTPNELTDGIEELLGPLNKIRVPVHEIAMIMSIALRFIPILLEETDKIMKAQIARGADLESGNMIQKAKSMIPILVPLFVSAFRRANDLAMAMEARCYHGGEGRTKMKPLKYCRKDRIAYITVIAYVVLVVLIGRFVPLHIWIF